MLSILYGLISNTSICFGMGATNLKFWVLGLKNKYFSLKILKIEKNWKYWTFTLSPEIWLSFAKFAVGPLNLGPVWPHDPIMVN